jgi:branched-chain amino acid transport system substrate-binding protein
MAYLRRRRAGAVLAAGSVIVLAACGSRLPESHIVDAARGYPAGAVASGTNLGAGGGSVVGANGTGSNGGGNGGGTALSPGATGALTGGPSGGATLAAGGPGGASGGASAGGGVAGSGSGGGAGAGGGVGSGAGSGSAPCTKQGSPIVIGQDGAFSGLVGQSTGNMKLGLSVWAKWVNAQGGLQCHPVQLYQEDDGSDPSTAAANVSDLVKNKHAVALVGSDTPIVIASEQSQADQLGVPMVGGDLVTTTWNTDPNLFPQGGSALQVYAGVMSVVKQVTHVTKVGLLYCVEASVCGVVNQNFSRIVAPSGMKVVTTKSISLTQASFTSECQTMKSGGVQYIFTFMDSASLARLTTSCNSLDYHPILGTSAIALAPSVFADPNIQRDNMFYGNSFVPFTATGTAALTAMHNAFKTYTGQDVQDENSVAGWTSGLLFGAAIDALGTSARNQAITPDMVRQGLWSLKRATLGGMVPPITYSKGKPAPINPCYSVLQLTTSGQKAPNGFKFACNNI